MLKFYLFKMVKQTNKQTDKKPRMSSGEQRGFCGYFQSRVSYIQYIIYQTCLTFKDIPSRLSWK